jgi:hypothetical protein
MTPWVEPLPGQLAVWSDHISVEKDKKMVDREWLIANFGTQPQRDGRMVPFMNDPTSADVGLNSIGCLTFWNPPLVRSPLPDEMYVVFTWIEGRNEITFSTTRPITSDHNVMSRKLSRDRVLWVVHQALKNDTSLLVNNLGSCHIHMTEFDWELASFILDT